jgi:long-chain acyl-CoA synthetase
MGKPADRPWFKFWPQGVPRHIDYPEIPLFKFLSDTAKKYPDTIAFSCQKHSLTYTELDIATGKLATALNELGVGRGDRVVLFLPNSPEFVIGYYGILKTGGTVSPANPLYKGEELKHQLNDCEAAVIITSGNLSPVVEAIRGETQLKAVILTDSLGEILAYYPPRSPTIALNPKEGIAAIEYTGGTTGLPKGAMLTHYNLVANAIQNATWFGWNNKDVIIGVIPFYHSWGACTCLNSPIYIGAPVVILPRFDAEELFITIERERATVLYGAASMFTLLVTSPLITKYDLSSLKYVKAGAMPIPPEIKHRWEQLTGVKMVLGYGLTEACPETHDSPLDRVKPGTVGIPIMDTDARIMDEVTGEVELPPGEVGELVIKGPQVMKGYLNKPEDNKEALRDGWLYTGDLVVMDEEGYFRIVDRKKEIMKYKGYTIAPAEVEAVLYQHPAVKECAVVGKPDALAGELPKAYIVLKDECTASEEELMQFCERRVAPYKKIREVEFIKEMPKTQLGKILRRVLRDKERST